MCYITKRIRSDPVSHVTENSKKWYVERRTTKRKIRKVEIPSLITERGGRGIGADRDDDNKSAGFSLLAFLSESD